MEMLIPIDQILKKIVVLYEDSVLKISYLDNSNKNTIIIFSYFQEPESIESIPFYRKNDMNIIHIVDKKNSWFNNFTPNFVLEKIKYLINDKKIYLVGASMGGFNAIIFSNFIKSERCVAFGPQYTIDLDSVYHPDDVTKFIKQIHKVYIKDIYMNSDTNYLFIFGNDKQEKTNYKKFFEYCMLENIKLKSIIFKDGRHDILFYIKEKINNEASNIVEQTIKKDFDKICQEYSNNNIFSVII